MKKLILSFIFILCYSFSFAQLSDLHYLPPLKQKYNSGFKDQKIYLSTPETTPFTVKIYKGTSTTHLLSITLSNASPYVYNLPVGDMGDNDITFVTRNNTGINLSSSGLRFESAGEKFYVNLRGSNGEAQGSYLTSKGRAALGKRFRWGGGPVINGSKNINATMGIMATENTTKITLSGYNPNIVFRKMRYPDGIKDDSYSITLNKGQSFVFEYPIYELGNYNAEKVYDEWLGALIVSDKDIVVSIGNAMYAPTAATSDGSSTGGRDIAIDQIIPENLLGTDYVFVRGYGDDNLEFPIIIATEDNTEIFVNGASTTSVTINAGKYYKVPGSFYSGSVTETIRNGENMYVRTSKPVYAYHSTAADNDPAYADYKLIAPVNFLLDNKVDFIPDIAKVGTVTTTINRGISIISAASTPDSKVQVFVNGIEQNSILSGKRKTISGNSQWVTYFIDGLSGDVRVKSPNSIAVGYIGRHNDLGASGYFYGIRDPSTNPTVVSIVTDDSDDTVKDGVTVRVTTTFGEEMTSAPTISIDLPNGTDISGASMTQSSTADIWYYDWTVSDGGSGTATITVAGSDLLGNAYAGGDTDTVTIDNTAPTVVSIVTDDSDDTVKDGVTVRVTTTFGEEMTSAPTISIDLPNGTDISGASMTQSSTADIWYYDWTVSDGGSGTATITVAGSDLLGNAYAGGDTDTVTIDNTAPTVVSIVTDDSDDTVKDGVTVRVTTTFGEEMTSAPTISIDLPNGTDISGASMTQSSTADIWYYDWTVSDGGSGTATITVAGSDLSGNAYAGGDTDTVTIDNTAPTVVSIVTDDSDDTVKDGVTVRVTTTFGEEMTSAPTISIDLPNGTDISGASMTQSSTADIWYYDWTVSDGGSGTATITVAGSDLSGNAYAGGDTDTVTIDNTAPTVVSIVTDDSDDTVKDGVTVRVTTTFGEEMTSAPTISIDLPNGTDISGASMTQSSTADIWYYDWTVSDGGSGTATITVAGSDLLGNAYAGGDTDTVTIDNTAPTVVSIVTDDSDDTVKDGVTVRVTTTFGEEMTSAPTISIDLPNGTDISGASMTQSSTADIWYYDWTVSDGGSGTATITVAGSDLLGNAYAGGDTDTVTIDNTAPTVVSIVTDDSDDTVKDGVTVRVTTTFGEEMTSAPTISIDLPNGTDISGASMTQSSTADIWYYDWTVSDGGSGTATITVAGSDLSGNAYAGGDTDTVTIDNIVPTITSIVADDSELNASETTTLTITLSEDSINFTVEDISLTASGTLSNFTATSSRVYTVLYTPTTTATTTTETVTIAAGAFTDIASNTNVANSITISIDTATPTIESFITLGDTSGYVAPGTSVTFTADFSESMAVAPYININDGSTTTSATMTVSTTADIWTYSWTAPNMTAVVTFTLSAEDLKDNPYTGTESVVLNVDNSNPTVILTDTDDDNIVRGTDTVTITATFSEPVVEPKLTVGTDISNAAFTVSPSTSSKTWYYQWTAPTGADGSYTVTLTATDLLGNAYTGTDSITFEVDSVSPTITSIVADDSELNASETTTLTITLSEDSINFTVEDISLTASGTLSNFTATSSRVYTVLYTPTTTATTTTETVTIAAGAFTDIASNTNVANSITISIDTATPTIESFITLGDTSGYVAPGTSVTFTADFSESMAVAPYININDGSTTTSATMTVSTTADIWTYSWTAPNMTAVVTFTLSAEDLKDNPYTGTESVVLNVDNSNPTVILTDTDDDNIVRGTDTVTITATFSEPVVEPKLTVGTDISNAAFTVSPSTSSKTWYYQWTAPTGADGSYTVTLTATDLLGNAYTGTDSITFEVDSVSPTITSIVADDSELNASETTTLTITLSEDSINFTVEDISLTASGTLSNFTATSSRVYTVLYTPTTTATTTTETVTIAAGVLTDIAGNTNTSTSTTLSIDTQAPYVALVTASVSNTYIVGETVSFTLVFNEPVEVATSSSSPTVSMTLSATAQTSPIVQAVYLSGSGTESLTFGYEVLEDDLDLDGIIINEISSGVDLIKDIAGNTASATLTNIEDTSNVLIDGVLPSIVRFDASWISMTDRWLGKSETLESHTVTITTSGADDGNLFKFELRKDDDSVSYTATTTVLDNKAVFSIVSSTLKQLSHATKYNLSGSVSDTAGNSSGIYEDSYFEVDLFGPFTAGISVQDGVYEEGEFIDFTFRMSDTNTNFGGPAAEIQVQVGTSVATITYDNTLSNSRDKVFRYVVQPGDVDLDGVEILSTSIYLPANSIFKDAAGNDGNPAIVGSIKRVFPNAIVDPNQELEADQINLTVNEGGSVSYDFASADREGIPYDYQLLSSTSHGQSSISSLTFTYEHNGNEAETDSLTYQISKATETATGTINISIIPVNDPPVVPAVQKVSLDIGQTRTFEFEAFDEEGDELTYFLVNSPVNGELEIPQNTSGRTADVKLSNDGRFTYFQSGPLAGQQTVPSEKYGFVYLDSITYYAVSAGMRSVIDGKVYIELVPLDHDNDGVPSRAEDLNNNDRFTDDDTDGDGIGDFLDTDDDGDFIPTIFENFFSQIYNGDSDADGIPNYLDEDDDNDGVLSKYEAVFNPFFNTGRNTVKRHKKTWDYNPKTWTPSLKGDLKIASRDEELEYPDTDGDGIPDFADIDDDGDGVLTKYEVPDQNGDGVPDDALDSDQETVPNYLDIDDDDDGVLTIHELPDQNGDGVPDDALDSDQEQIPNYLDVDDDNDSILTFFELPDQNGDGIPDDALDSDNEQIPNYLDVDDDNDSIPTINEIPDQDGDGIPDDALNSDGEDTPNYIDVDDDNDEVLTIDEDEDGDGNPLNNDRDGDGLIDAFESFLKDEDQDGVSDEYDSENENPNNDQDGDGFGNQDETLCGFDPLDPNSYPADMDADGTVNCLDDDIDGDGVLNEIDNNPEVFNPFQDFNLDRIPQEYYPSIPEIFSPNGDGINDTWNIINIERYPNATVNIFTRTGKSVFEMKRYNNSWNGTSNGQPLPEASYYYMIDIDGNGTIDFQGWVFLTR